MPRLVVNPARLNDNCLQPALRHLIGTWRDADSVLASPSYYEVNRNESEPDCFDVYTCHHSGEAIMSYKLICVDRIANGWSRIVWDCVFETARITTTSITRKRDHKEVRWRRDVHAALDPDEHKSSFSSGHIRYHRRHTTYSEKVHDRDGHYPSNASSRSRSRNV